MEGILKIEGPQITWQCDGETLLIQPWGPDGIRVRATALAEFPAVPGALLDPPPSAPQAAVERHGQGAALVNGLLRAEIGLDGRLRYFNTASGEMLLAEPEPYFNRPPARWWRFERGDLAKLVVRFEPNPEERFYGLGQHQHGLLNQKGCVIELEQRNTEVCIPFALSSRGYGFLWNNPGIGQVELGENGTRWVAEGTRIMDYYLVAGESCAAILQRYADVTGHAPLLPEWALGFWQCKLRYRTQEELMEVAREYRRRGVPLSIIVTDYFHWSQMGSWEFDPQCWPDPAAMIRELAEMGTRLMVSIWPTVNPNNPAFQEMKRNNWLVRAEKSPQTQMFLVDTTPPGQIPVCYYDPMNPGARRYVWEKIRRNYYQLGVRVYWLDADEPEIYPMAHSNLRYYLGNGLEVSNIYPLFHQQGFWENLRPEGQEDEGILALSRSAWAGSQRYGAAVWSGDIHSTFDDLRRQVTAGLNIGLSGIPWWTTDIGGFNGGNIYDPAFRELLIRWFQYGAFCPLFRIHGNRLPPVGDAGFSAGSSGSPNEIWSYGEEAYEILRRMIFIRERLRPYLKELARAASEKGQPVMRPLFYDFPQDRSAEAVADQFMLGPDLMVAPVLEPGATARNVYLPPGSKWVDAWTGRKYTGEGLGEALAPIDRIPVFWRADSPYLFRFDRV